MQAANRHIIRKQTVDVAYYGKTDGFLLQKEITEWCNNELATKLAKQLDRLGNSSKVYRIDKLELDIELNGGSEWKELASEQIELKLRVILNDRIANNQTEEISPAQKFFEEFVYFLQYGNLPWWIQKDTSVSWLELMNKFLDNDLSNHNKSTLIELLKVENYQIRVSFQLPDKLFEKLIIRLYPGTGEKLFMQMKEVKLLTQEASDSIRRSVLQKLHKAILSVINQATEENVMQSTIEDFVRELDNESLVFLSQRKESILSTELKQLISERLVKKPEAIEPKHKKDSDKKDILPVIKEGVFVDNAGLVIIAAFLPAFFKKLTIVSGNNLTDPHKAACLIQFLASGKEQVAEFELGLARILSGLELDEPVNTMLKLTEEEKKEVDELLQSVLEYWKILKNTSVESLRESFLMRAGKLSFDGKEWLLQVEPKGYDVLLQNLPWNISIIKLPWMKYLLRTEWVN